MSERTLAWLFRLYPAAFRQKYEQDTLQLYRDRMRDERGLLRRLRLTCDLVVDAATGLRLAWRNSYAETSVGTLAGDAIGLPGFHLLQREPLGAGAVVAGCLFSISALVGFGLVMRIPAPVCAARASATLSPIEAVVERLNRVVATPGDGDREARAAVEGGDAQAQTTASAAAHAEKSGEPPLDAQEKGQVVQGVADHLTAHYFDRQKALAAMERLRELEKQGAYAGIVDGRMLAERLTADLRSATGDPHLSVAYSRNSIPNTMPGRPTASALIQYRTVLLEQNCAVEKVERLPGNIGYLKLNSFPDMEVCGPTLRKALAQIGGANGVIFDLRDNTGGFPETVADVAAPLFERPVAWYNPKQTQSATTLTPAPGSKLANKPVYILTSSRTFSGAEQFTYNLKMLKRATVIGETTGGGGHVGVFHRVDEHFGVGIPETKISNPYGMPDWDGVGVEPDVKVKAANALGEAEKLAAKVVGR